jgi:sulfur relay (sulfurtransferase) DsrF/TusC family protein
MRGFPWQLILKQAPHLIKAAGELLMISGARSATIASANDVHALRDRVAELAKDQQAYATLMKELTEQLNAITEVAHATAASARQAVIFASIAVGLGLVACVLALVR